MSDFSKNSDLAESGIDEQVESHANAKVSKKKEEPKAELIPELEVTEKK